MEWTTGATPLAFMHHNLNIVPSLDPQYSLYDRVMEIGGSNTRPPHAWMHMASSGLGSQPMAQIEQMEWWSYLIVELKIDVQAPLQVIPIEPLTNDNNPSGPQKKQGSNLRQEFTRTLSTTSSWPEFLLSTILPFQCRKSFNPTETRVWMPSHIKDELIINACYHQELRSYTVHILVAHYHHLFPGHFTDRMILG